jgi:glycosyltransferase involved in cell wall biosynthesis
VSGISAVVPTYNADWRLERCLESLRYADELVIVDMCSTNDTAARARTFTDRVYVRDGGGDINANINFGLSQARHEYIHLAPQDHVISPELAAELRQIAAAGSADVVELEQRNFKFGREILFGGATDRWVRAFGRKEALRAPEGRLHEPLALAPNARVVRARARVLHNSDVSISDWLTKQNRFTDLDVSRLGFSHHADIMKPLGAARVSLRMARIFFNLYVKRHGYRDGLHGYLLAMFAAFYNLTEQAKLFERHWSWDDLPAEIRPPAAKEKP